MSKVRDYAKMESFHFDQLNIGRFDHTANIITNKKGWESSLEGHGHNWRNSHTLCKNKFLLPTIGVCSVYLSSQSRVYSLGSSIYSPTVLVSINCLIKALIKAFWVLNQNLKEWKIQTFSNLCETISLMIHFHGITEYHKQRPI